MLDATGAVSCIVYLSTTGSNQELCLSGRELRAAPAARSSN